MLVILRRTPYRMTAADAHDIGATVHPHPTLSETFAFAAEMFEGSITDLIPPKKKAHT